MISQLIFSLIKDASIFNHLKIKLVLYINPRLITKYSVQFTEVDVFTYSGRSHETLNLHLGLHKSGLC